MTFLAVFLASFLAGVGVMQYGPRSLIITLPLAVLLGFFGSMADS